MDACLPPCDPLASSASNSSVCLELADASGKHCSRSACNTLRSCLRATCSGPVWLTPLDVTQALMSRSHGTTAWWFFLGDSDTRGLALHLLQMVAEATAGSQAGAAERRELWFRTNASTSGGGGRICHFDWEYDARLRLTSSRQIDCTAPQLGSNNVSYIAPFVDYDVSETSGGSALRITFVTVDVLRKIPATARLLASMFAARPQASPSVFYASFGSWWKNNPATDGLRPEVALANGLRSIADALPRATLVFGTILGMKHRIGETILQFQDSLLQRLPQSRWVVFWRDSSLAIIAGNAGWKGIKLSSRHAPHLVNWVDNQRLLLGLSTHREPKRCSPDASVPMRFSPQCAGFQVDSKLYLAAWLHHCDVKKDKLRGNRQRLNVSG